MIKIICVGKIKERFYQEAILEYQKRLSKYTKLKIVEVSDYDSKNPALELEKEKDAILKQIGDRDYVIVLDINGSEIDSISLSQKLEQVYLKASTITFVIGGSSGLHNSIKEKANYTLSFSKLTFPHQLFRILLLEQIYRSYKISYHESYHK